MALNPKTAVARRNAMLDNCLGALDGGFLDIYDGTQPVDADTPINAQVKLARLTFGTPAFDPAANGSASAKSIASDISADATGTATWFRCLKTNGTSVFDGSVGTSGANLNLNSVIISAGALVSCSSFVVTQAP